MPKPKKIAAGVRALLHYPVLVLFGLLFGGLFLLDLVTPDKQYSEMENTRLAQRPALTAFTAQGLNSFFTNYSQYVKDQVVFRDGWIALQGACETLLFQKTQNGGILLGDEGMMFARTYSLLASEQRNLPRNVAALQSLAQKHPGKLAVMLVPSAATVYPGRVPAGAPLLDEAAMLADIRAQVEQAGGLWLPVADAFAGHEEEYLYYRTDHHWTSHGAYLAYRQLCEALGLAPFDTAAHTQLTVPDFYGTHYAKARTWNAQPDTITYYDLPNRLEIYNVTGPDGGQPARQEGLYNTAQFALYDKYAAFLWGNNGYSRVYGDGEGRILVLKDSYANSFIPYLTANFAEIDVIDFRNFNYGLDTLAAQNQYDQILVLYSLDSFKGDMYFYRAGIDG